MRGAFGDILRKRLAVVKSAEISLHLERNTKATIRGNIIIDNAAPVYVIVRVRNQSVPKFRTRTEQRHV